MVQFFFLSGLYEVCVPSSCITCSGHNSALYKLAKAEESAGTGAGNTLLWTGTATQQQTFSSFKRSPTLKEYVKIAYAQDW